LLPTLFRPPWYFPPIHKFPSGSYSYRHIGLSFFSTFHKF
jgi:hypothetical protein